MRQPLLLLVFAVCAVLIPSASIAAVPPLLNYQGVLQDATGDPVPDGNYSVTFRIWDAETSGAALWQEGRLVSVQDGLFTVLLGSIVPIPDTLFSNPNRWIGLQVGLDAEMSPRQRLVSVPYAWHSLAAVVADTARTAESVDTSGYSAYDDLLSESRIGAGANQVAPGDHVHSPGIGTSHMMRYEDTSAVTINTTSSGTLLLKSVTVPAAEIGNYMRIVAAASSTGPSASNSFGVYVNGELLFPRCGDWRQNYTVAWSFELSWLENTYWTGVALSPNPTGQGCPDLSEAYLQNLPRGAQITVELRVQKNDTSPVTYRAGELIVIYDKD